MLNPGAVGAAALAAQASISPNVQYLNDTTGTLFTLTVKNTGSTHNIGAVQIKRPFSFWTVTACPSGPAGWARLQTASRCRYVSAAGSADDIKPGQTRTFTFRTTTAPAAEDRSGLWTVIVSRLNHFANPSALKQAGSMGTGLKIRAFSFQILSAVVRSGPATPGAPCPATDKDAVAGSTGNTIVICGRNRSTGTLTPKPRFARLRGTFIADNGSFSSGPVAPTSTSRVLGNWSNVEITNVSGPGKTIEARVGSSRSRRSPWTTLTGYTALNSPPVVTTSGGSTAYTEGDPATVIDGALTVADADDATLTEARARISAGFNSASDQLQFTNMLGITGSYNASTGILTLTGSASVADYQTALRSIKYLNTSDIPTTSRTVAFRASDDAGPGAEATKTIAITPVNDAPSLAASGGSASFTENGAAVVVDSGITVTDPDSQIAGATVQIAPGFAPGEDQLGFVDMLGITGSYNSATGVLTLTGIASVANYQTALRSVTYDNTSEDPSTDTRTVTFQVTDDGALNSNVVSRDVTVAALSDAPVVITSPGSIGYTEGGPPVPVDPGITVTDADSANLVSAIVTIANFEPGDELDFTNQSGITGFWDGFGTLSLTGSATVIEYEIALRSILYSTTSNNPSSSRTIAFTVFDDDGLFSNTATKTIAITAIDEAPTAVDDSATVLEDSAAAAINVLANDTDPDGGPLTISSASDPANGTVALTGGSPGAHTGLTYQPDPNYCNDPPGTSPDTFTYTVNGGSTATVSVTVTCVDDVPVVTTSVGSTAYTEGDPAAAIDGSLTVSDADDANLEGATVSITTNFQSGDLLDFTDQLGITGSYSAGTGVLTLTGSASIADYQTALRTIAYGSGLNENPATSKTISFAADDGSGLGPVATKNLAITPVNDPPTLTTSVGDLNYNEGNGPVAIDNGILVADPDSANLTGGTVQITGNFLMAEDELAFTDMLGITGSYNDTTGTLTLSGLASVASYQTALRSVTYENSAAPASTATRTVTFQVTDDGALLSNAATRDITVSPPNGTPVADSQSPSVNEDTPVLITLTGSDGDDENLTFTAVDPAHGSLDTLTPVADCTALNTCTAQVTYTPDANYFGADSFTFMVNDGTVDSGAAAVSITVNPVNDAPSFNKGGDETVDEDAGAQTVIGWATAISAGPANESGQVINFIVSNDNNALFSVQPAVSATGTLNYTPAADAFGSATVSVSIHDDGGTANGGDDTSDAQTFTITVNPVNDVPSFTKGGDETVDEDAGAQTVVGWATAISAGAANESAQVINFIVSNDNNALFSVQPAVSPAGDLTYTSAPDAFGSATVTVSLHDDGGTANGGDDTSDAQTFTITVNPVNDAPVADDETFSGNDSAIGNTTLQVDDPTDDKPAPLNPHTEIAGDILAGDTDVDGPGPLTISAGTFATNDGGSVTIEADGDFVFQPAAATSCADSSDFFDYTVSDNDPIDPRTDTGRVTINIVGCVWYVNNNAAGNSGTSVAPFDTLAQAEAASGANHTVFVYDGDNTSTGYDTGYAMNAGERLIGEHEGLVVDPDGGGALTADTLWPANPGALPTLTANNEDVIDLDDGNEVRGFVIDPQGTGGGIAGAAGDTGGGTIDDVSITDSGTAGTQPGLELDGTTGTWNFSNLTVSTSGATGVRLNNAGTVNFAAAGTISITTTGAKGLDATGTNMGTSVFDDITVTGSGSGAVSMTSTTGTTTFGDGSGTDLALTTTSGATGAFVLSNAGTVTVPAGGTANVSATGGPAIDVTGTAGAALAFDDVDSTNSSTDGINLDGLAAGTFSATSGDITGAAGISFDLNGGSGAITYPGNFGNGSGTTAIEVTGRTGGAVVLSGSISDSSDAGGGLNLSSNTGGSTTLSNATKQFNTGASAAVTFNTSDGHTLTLSGGNLDIDTTSGSGLAATSSGTLVVTGAANTITTTTGTALNVTSTDIGAGGLTFQSISANGGSNGIVLSSTGATGSLTVTGNGGTCTNADKSGCSGGQIQNMTGGDDSTSTPPGTGIVLNSTLAPSFTRVWLHDNSNYAIRGTSVAGFNLANSVIGGTNGTNSSSPFNDSSVLMLDLTGSATVSNSDIRGGYANNFSVVNASGSLDRITFSSDTFGDNNATNGNDAVHLESSATASVFKATIEDSTFTAAAGDLVNYIHNGSGAGDLVVSDNAFSNNHPGIATGGGGLSLVSDGLAGATTMSITNNTFRDAVGPGVLIVKTTGSSTQTGTFSGNTIGVSGVANSGSAEGSALKLQTVGQGSMTWSITNNFIYGYNNNGIEVLAGGGATLQSGAINTIITGNTIAQPGTTLGTLTIPKNGIHFNIGTVPGDTYQACAVIGGAGALANSLSTSGADAVPPAGGGQDIRLRQRQSTTIRLPGYAGANNDDAAVQTFVAANNGGNGVPQVIASNTVPTGGGYTGTGTSCP